MKTHFRISRLISTGAADLGLSPGQPKVLEFLIKQGESNQKMIADHCEIEAATVGTILTKMERDGLIFRSRKDNNRRALYVSLTERGQEYGKRMEDIFRKTDSIVVSQLTETEQKTLSELLFKVYSAVEIGKEGMPS